MSAATLKYIAILSMLMDHIWVSLFNRSEAFIFMHYFGRLAFPIFCFLLVEGYRHTGDIRRYMKRLLVFALISEVPYDLFLYKEISMKDCNVMFTLLLGLAAIAAWDHFSKKGEYAEGIATFIAAMFVATLIKADYLFLGVALIAVMHIIKGPLKDMISAGLLFAAGSGWGIPSIGLMHLYNGEKGHQWKWFFYIFYPVHLAILAAMSGIK